MSIRYSGPLPITEITAEFGGVLPHGLSEYYGNGTFLSPGYFPNPPAVPSTGSPLNVGAFYGKSKRRTINVTISSNTAQVNVHNLFANLIAQSTVAADCVLTIDSGVTVYGVTAQALVVRDIFRSVDSVTIINRGNIVGFAGTGGSGGCSANFAGNDGTMGGIGVVISRPTRILNYGIIAGGAKGGKGGTGGTTGSTNACSASIQCPTCQTTTTYPANSWTWSAAKKNCWCNQGGCCSENWCFSTAQGDWPNLNHIKQIVQVCHNCTDSQRSRNKTYPGCHGIKERGWTRRGPIENGWTSQTTYNGNCSTVANTCGGMGGNGATPFSNIGIAGGPSTGGSATAGSSGGLWGSGGNAIVGMGNLLGTNELALNGGLVIGGMVN